MPLGAKAPAEAVRYLKVDTTRKSLAEVQQFIDTLRGFMDEAESADSDMGRVATIYDIKMQSVKKMTSADLVDAVSPTGEGRVVVKKLDPNQSHPYNQTELLDKVNQRRKGRRLTSYDYQVPCWKEKLRDNPKYAWKHEHSPTYLWSGDAVSYLAGLDDEVYDQARADYRNRARAR
ncbi:hypothetical protein NFA_50060 [Nocardia farcinica IFM 10152]|uniref:EC042-2821-like Restriction Endonuclease-like domain-containing protein n=1 Tax=Nocardia farcinica (strain IFM 10152) TaxID=247156 RepID=Q5YPN3_NOCFA|nr:hypothetical protein NFA_50060 [Nocardia farcinica IFM 10152]